MSKTIKKVVLVILLWIAGLLAGGQFAKVSVVLPELRALYPMQAEQVAWLLTLVSVVGALLGGTAASLANRFGLRAVLLVALVAASGLSFWQSTYPAFSFMALSRIIEGVTHLGIVVTAPALMAETSNDRWRGTTMALWGTFFGVSFAIFGWFGIPLVEEFGINHLFQIHGACLLVIAALIGTLCIFGDKPDAPSTEPPKRHTPSLTAFQDIRVLWPGIVWLFYTTTFLAFLTILPAQLPAAVTSHATTAMSLVGIATGLLILPIALLRFKATTMVLVGFVLAALITAPGVWTDLLILAIMLFACLGLIQSATFAAVAELNHRTETRTLGYGVMAQTGNLGNLFGTPLLLFVLSKSDLDTLLTTGAAIYGVGFVALAILVRRVPAKQTRS